LKVNDLDRKVIKNKKLAALAGFRHARAVRDIGLFLLLQEV
jgi:hypothetical protein